VRGLINTEEEMYEVLKARHKKLQLLAKVIRKSQVTKTTRNCSVIYSGYEQSNGAQSGGTRTIFTSSEITEL